MANLTELPWLHRRPRAVVEAVRSWSPAFVFSTSSPAPVVAAALASFKYNLEHDTQRKHLLAIIDHLKSGLRDAGIPLVSQDSHIMPVLVGDPHRNKHISKQLLDEYDILRAAGERSNGTGWSRAFARYADLCPYS